MADAASSVNGIYATQYGQPAELAATTPGAPVHASSASQSSTVASGAASQKADPQEIGWYFVEQYYTTLSKSPERIHLFYKKKSQLVTGVEAEKVMTSVGEKAISEKIKSLDIRDCKVRVLNVDSQASFSNIVVQVIGEMSNKNQPHHKFVQTFVLAEQPNGYFVLNDIFRYLNDEEDEIIEDEIAPEIPAEQPATPADESVAVPTEELVTNEAAAEEVDEKLEEDKDAEVEVEAETPAPVNGIDDEEPVEEPAVTAGDEETTDPVKADAQEGEAESEPSEPEATPATTTKAPEPASDAQPVRKTWASMVGGKAPAVPALPAQPAQPAVPAQPKAQKSAAQSTAAKPSAPEPVAASPSPTPSNGWQTADHGKKGRSATQTKSDGNVLAYIKNVNEKVDARTLREVLEKYGELKYYDVSRGRNCAFVEFANPEGYAAAVAANPHTVGSETITVEERRPRPGAYGGTNATFGRGTTQNTRGRGNMQQRTGSQSGSYPKDAPRGGMQQPQQQRGGKSGNVTPRGRGQSQAA